MKRKSKSRGIITVFVTLMLVPMVICTGTMVDAARLKLYSSQAAMVADAYGEVVLSEYDNLLKDLYGLFSVTQQGDGLDAITELADYSKYAFVPNGDAEKDNRGISGFMPYKGAEVTISYEKLPGSTLAEDDVFMTQISEFMKFRVVEAMLGSQMLEKLGTLESADTDRKVVEKRQELTKGCDKVLGYVDEYYKVLKTLSEYPSYVKERITKYTEYSNRLKNIVNNVNTYSTKVYSTSTYDYEDANVKYEKYVYYLNHKKVISDAVTLFENIEKAEAHNEKEETTKAEKEAEGKEYTMKKVEVPSYTSDDKKNAQAYVNASTYKSSLENALSGYNYSSVTTSTKAIKFGEVETKVKKLEELSGKIKQGLQDLEKRMGEINEMLPNCSPSLRTSMEEELRDLQTISKDLGDFSNTVKTLKDKDIAGKDKTNFESWKTKVGTLDDIKSAVLAGTHEVNKIDWSTSISLEYYDFTDASVDKTTSDFYKALEKMCASSESEGGDKNAGDKKVKEAEEETKKVKEDMEGNEETSARNINDAWTKKEGASLEPAKKEDDKGSNWSGGISLSSVAGTAMDKFLLTTYNFGMFSSRVTGIEPPKKDDKAGEATPTVTPAPSEEKEEYKEYSLTKVEKSRDVNYLYEAELEYLVAGNNESVKNLNYVRNVISTIRFPMNFVSTYTVSEINKGINEVARIASDAVLATGVAAWVAPVVYVTVSAALRTTVATMETVMDWSELKLRKEVIFYKSDIDDLTSYEKIKGFIPEAKGSGDKKKSAEVGFTYEDYLYIMMLLFTDQNKLLNRTSNLITLNVNQSQNTTGKDLETLDFKMIDTFTAIKSTCQVNEKFIIVPDNFAKMFFEDDSSATATIQMLDDGSYAYSVIRGY